MSPSIRGTIAGALRRVADGISLTPHRTSRQSSVWSGASTDRLYQDWDAWTTSPDFETRYAFRLMRARARSLAKNNPWIVGFLDELANNIVGANGIRLHAQIKNALGTLSKATNQEIERGWEEWSYPENASADGHDSWTELQRIIIQTIAVDGECFVRRIQGADNPFGYTLQIIDADLVDETYSRGAGPGQNRIVMGVEVDKHNRPIAYHVWTRYAEDMTGEPRTREPIPADQLLHLFPRWHRSNIPRGITWFAPVLTSVRHVGEYETNHLVASRAAAAKMIFIVNKSATAIENYEPPAQGEQPRMWDMEPGVAAELLPGQEIAPFDPTFPTIAYEQFVSAVLRGVARGLKVSYLTLTGDLRGANYSSMRAGLLPERDHWRSVQIWFATHCHRLVYRDWIDVAALKRAVAVDNRLGSDYYDVAWHGRGWKWVDPFNDLKAAKLELDLGLNSRTRLHAERGTDYEDVVDELAEEQDYAEEADVDVSGNQITGVNPTTVSPEGVHDDAADPGGEPKDTKDDTAEPADSTKGAHDGVLRLTAVS